MTVSIASATKVPEGGGYRFQFEVEDYVPGPPSNMYVSVGIYWDKGKLQLEPAGDGGPLPGGAEAPDLKKEGVALWHWRFHPANDTKKKYSIRLKCIGAGAGDTKVLGVAVDAQRGVAVNGEILHTC